MIIYPTEHQFLSEVDRLKNHRTYDYETGKSAGLTVALTNGVYDVIHPGHVAFLREAWEKCDVLIVLVNSDRSVRELKGPSRPIHSESDRAAMVSALRWVNTVCVFDDTRITRWLELIKPNIWFKGGDYTVETLDPDEVAMARQVGAQIELIPIRVRTSTTAVLQAAGIA